MVLRSRGVAMRWGWAAFIILVGASPVLAAGYDDFSRGISANFRGDSDVAIKAFTTALNAGDLVPAYVPAAYRGRATAYLVKDMCAEGAADLKAYAALGKPDADVLDLRIWAELCLKDTASAQRDFDTLVGSNPGPLPLWSHARMQWRYGLYAEAATSAERAFSAANKKGYRAPYILLWYALDADLAGTLDRNKLRDLAKLVEMDSWPGPLMGLYLEKSTPAKVADEASSWTKSLERARMCEANFYTAEWYLGRNDSNSALPLLEAAAEQCPVGFIESSHARVELKRLGRPIPAEKE